MEKDCYDHVVTNTVSTNSIKKSLLHLILMYIFSIMQKNKFKIFINFILIELLQKVIYKKIYLVSVLFVYG